MLGRHLLGIYEKAFPEDWSWERRLAEAKALGFDYMELSIDESDGRLERLLWSGRELEKLHSLSVEAGLPLMSLCLSAHRRFPLGSRDAEVRAAELDRGAGSIVAVHLKDTLAVGRDFPGQFRSVPFGSGCVDFKSCFARLEAAGYAGPYMIEMWSSGGPGDSAEIARVKRWLELQFAAGVLETQRCGNELLSRIG